MRSWFKMDWDVTIGIPVYNGEDKLEMTLDSLVKNHLGVREIIISDNASTDRTAEIIKRFADEYDNIKHIRQPKTISFWENHLATLKLAKGKYFMFMGHHDLISENYFSELVPLLENDPQAVIAIPSIRGFLKTPGDLPEEKQGRYFNPLKSGVMSDNLRERVNAVLKDGRTCYMFTQLFPTEVIRKIWAEIYSQHCPHLDHVSAMCTVLLGKCKASDKAFYYFESSDRLDETPEKRRQRYSRNFQTFIPTVNDHGHVPRRYWQLCQKFAPNISDELLYNDIKVACSQFMDADFNDEDWLERHVVMSPPNVAAPRQPGLPRYICGYQGGKNSSVLSKKLCRAKFGIQTYRRTEGKLFLHENVRNFIKRKIPCSGLSLDERRNRTLFQIGETQIIQSKIKRAG